MPNNCSNNFTISKVNADQWQKLADSFQVRGEGYQQDFLKTFFPEPDWQNTPNEKGHLPGPSYMSARGYQQRRYFSGPALGPKTTFSEAPKSPDGKTDHRWYGWRIDNWGTKWDVSDEGLEFIDNKDGTAVITGWFDSAWAPPIGAYQIFDEMMDNCYITASYHEPGMDFAGFYESEGGEEYLENLSDQFELDETERDDLFRRIDEEFGIVEQYEMWREEETV